MTYTHRYQSIMTATLLASTLLLGACTDDAQDDLKEAGGNLSDAAAKSYEKGKEVAGDLANKAGDSMQAAGEKLSNSTDDETEMGDPEIADPELDEVQN